MRGDCTDAISSHVSRFAAVLCLALLFAAAGASARDDLLGWQGTRWGMDEDALFAVHGDALRPLPGRQIYGGAYAEQTLSGIEIGGEPFMAVFQMEHGTDRLQQVLLRWTRRQPSERANRAILDALRARYGREDLVCRVPKAGAGDLIVERVWRFPTTTVHLSLLDFYTSAIAFQDPNSDRDPLVPSYKTRRNNPRFLPRSVLVRFHPTARVDLMGRTDCRAP